MKINKILTYMLSISILSTNIYAITIDDILSKSNIKKYDAYRESIIRNANILSEYNNVGIRGGYQYNHTTNKASNNISGGLSWGGLSYNIGYGIEGKKVDHSISFDIGLNKYFYNFYEKSDIESKLNRLKFNKDKKKQESNLINTYINYKNKMYEKEIILDNKKLMDKSKLLMNKKYNLGMISKIEYLTFNNDYELLELNLIRLETEINLLKNEFNTYGINDIDYDNEIFEDIKVDETNLIFNDDEYIKNVELQTRLEQLSRDEYIAKELVPDIGFKAQYDITNNSYGLGVTVGKNFNIFDVRRYDFIKAQKEAEEKAKNIISTAKYEMETLKMQLLNLKINLKSLERKLLISEKNQLVYDKKYKQGSMSYIEYIDKRNKYMNEKLEFEKLKNELAKFILNNKK